jgi:hypothetical protein
MNCETRDKADAPESVCGMVTTVLLLVDCAGLKYGSECRYSDIQSHIRACASGNRLKRCAPATTPIVCETASATSTVLRVRVRLPHPPGVPEVDAIEQDRTLVTWC